MHACKSSDRLKGKTVIITGVNSGIGYETAKELAWMKARVIMTCRDLAQGALAMNTIKRETGNRKLELRYLDMSSFESIKHFADDINSTEPKVHILILSEGIIKDNVNTADDLNGTLQLNHFGPFLLINLLIEKLKQSAPCRIINVSSSLHKYIRPPTKLSRDLLKGKGFNSVQKYPISKLYFLAAINELARRLKPYGVTANSLHPGTSRTNISSCLPRVAKMDNLTRLCYKTEHESAQTSIYLAISSEVEWRSGEYFAECATAKMSPYAADENFCKTVCEISEDIVGLNCIDQTTTNL